MAGVLKVLVERRLEPREDVVLFSIGASLLSDSDRWLLASHTDLVQQDVVDHPFSLLLHIAHALKHIDVTDAISFSRSVQGEHPVDEISFNIGVCVEKFLHGWVVLERAPWLRPLVRLDNATCCNFCLTIFIFTCFDSLLRVSQHLLILTPVEFLQLDVAKLVLVIFTAFIELKLELFHNIFTTCFVILLWRHANVD